MLLTKKVAEATGGAPQPGCACGARAAGTCALLHFGDDQPDAALALSSLSWGKSCSPRGSAKVALLLQTTAS